MLCEYLLNNHSYSTLFLVTLQKFHVCLFATLEPADSCRGVYADEFTRRVLLSVSMMQLSGMMPRSGLVVGRRTCNLGVAGSRPGRDAAAQQP